MSDTKTQSPEDVRLALRQAIIDSSKPLSREVEFFGQIIELRQPSLEVILGAQDDADDDRKAAIIRLIISYSYTPGTDVRIFTEHDAEIIGNMPFGADMARINAAIAELTDVDVLGAEKNSEETQGD